MEFGPEIAIEGKRPEWVMDDTICAVCNDGEWFGLGVQIEAKEWCAWENPCSYTAIRLPADHPHYTQALAEHALEAQYKGEPLPGVWVDPDDAPEMTAADFANATAEFNGERLEMVGRISTMMLLPMMTREECLAKADEKEWSTPSTSRMAYLNAYEDLGLIREVAPPTDLERYKAETGAAIGGIEDAIEAAIKWARGNS